MWPASDVDVDPACGDRSGKLVEREVLQFAGPAHVAAEVGAAEDEVDAGEPLAGLTDQLPDPVPAELVPVRVEEDVVVLFHGKGREQLRVRPQEQRLGALRAQLAEAVQGAFGVRQDEVVLAWVGASVDVEAGVTPAVLRQAHRHIRVVVHDRNPEALAERRRNATQMAHRHRENDHGVDVPLTLEDSFEMPLPTRRHVAPDQLARGTFAQ